MKQFLYKQFILNLNFDIFSLFRFFIPLHRKIVLFDNVLDFTFDIFFLILTFIYDSLHQLGIEFVLKVGMDLSDIFTFSITLIIHLFYLLSIVIKRMKLLNRMYQIGKGLLLRV